MRFKHHVFYEADGTGAGAGQQAPAGAYDQPQGDYGNSGNESMENPFDAVFRQGLQVVTNDFTGESDLEVTNGDDEANQQPASETVVPDSQQQQPQSLNQQASVLDNVINGTQQQQPQQPQQQFQQPAPANNGYNPAYGNQNANAPFGGEQQQAVQPYSPQEFSLALQLNSVDESRIPAEYRSIYEAQRQADPNYVPEQDPGVIRQREAEMQFFSNVDEKARELAMQAVDLTPEEVEAASYSDEPEMITKYNQYLTAVNWHKNSIINNIQQEAQRRRQAQEAEAQEQTAMLREAASFIQELKAKEPNFDKIDQYMSERYKNLPYEQAMPVAQIYSKLAANPNNPQLTRDEWNTLRQYYDNTRVEFYARNNNLQVNPTRVPAGRPPYVETPATGAGGEASLDVNQLSTMDNDQQEEFLQKYFFG